MVPGKAVVTGAPNNIIVTPLSREAAFIGASSDTSGSTHVFSLGILHYFTCPCGFFKYHEVFDLCCE